MDQGLTIWLTGLSGAGKSTLAGQLATALRSRGRRVEVLDGDEVRERLSQGLGFSRADRDANVQRIAYLAHLLSRNGTIAIVAAISPYRAARDEARAQIGAFVEVYVRCPLNELERRDVKGLYARARRGEIANFTGVSDPYEAPLTPDVSVDSEHETPDDSSAAILAHLEAAGYLTPVPAGLTPALAGVSARPTTAWDEHLPSLLQHDDRQGPQEILRWALATFATERLAVCTSFQADGMAILDMAWRINPQVRVFTVDTGRLPQATHDMVDRVRERYGLAVEVYTPNAGEVMAMVRDHGANLFRQSAARRLLFCDVRKVRPLVQVLHGLDAWVTGLRRGQSATRSHIRTVEVDHDHGGLVKVNPQADWTEEQVWDYLKANDVPTHALYAQGYQTIGCAPCTRATAPGEEARDGRWWRESDAPKECGMHCAIELVGSVGGRRQALAAPAMNGHQGH